MEQTTVNQYFTARKHSSSFQPSKRRKLDVDNDIIGKISSKRKSVVMEKRSTKQQSSTKSTSSMKNGKNRNELTVTQLLVASPVVINTEITQTKDDHLISPKRKVARRNSKPDSKNPSQKTGPSSESMKSPRLSSPDGGNRKAGKLPIKQEINEQAKVVMYSRGKALANAGLLNKNNQALKSPSKVSDVLQAISPQKVRHESESLAERRSCLRNKYAHLLERDSSLSSRKEESATVEPNLCSAASKTTSERPYQKYKHLLNKAVPSTFPLPSKYKVLVEMFRCADSVLFLLNQRSEICTYERLKKSVQTMCGKEFTFDHLAAMKTVYPNGFIFRQEKNLHSSGSKTAAYQLTVEANFKDCLLTNKGKLTSSVLITRKLKFETNILEITKSVHQKFLKKLNIKLDDKEIRRWHPNFKLDEVPDIPLAVLPQAPITRVVSTAADLLHKTGNNSLVPKVEKALENVVRNSEEQLNVSEGKAANKPMKSNEENRSNSSNMKLKGVSISILERIREKERKKMELAMTRDPKQEVRIAQMARLPEMARILKTYFTAEKKAAITMEDCVQKLFESYGSSLQHDKIDEHVRLLSELVPSWLSIVLVRKCPFVKLVKSYDINNVLDTLSRIRKEEQNK